VIGLSLPLVFSRKIEDQGLGHIFPECYTIEKYVPVAQIWIERGSPKAGVVGSNPTRDIFIKSLTFYLAAP
jgi:hypothetical protein